jgi:hypothetical protein
MDMNSSKEKEVATIDKINKYFKLPIYYNEQKHTLNTNITNDLELVESNDASYNPMYSFLFNADNEFSKKLISQVAEYYTTDVHFLKDSQILLKTYKSENEKPDNSNNKYETIINIWKEVKEDGGFKERYYYIDWSMWEFLNKSEQFLQFMSIYNLASPVISLFVPILILIVPFFIIKLKGLAITMSQYISILKVVISNNAIGKLFTQFSSVTAQEKLYMLVSAGFYVFSIYQNILTCVRFNNNMIKIHEHLNNISKYLKDTIGTMKNYMRYSENLATHQIFNEKLKEKMNVLIEFETKIGIISKYEFHFKKIFEIGHILKCFYELYEDSRYEDAFLYSFGFNGYIDCVEGIIRNISERKMNFVTFISNKKKNIIKNNYYAALKDDTPVKNDIKFKKNIIITGPNASGKTTILKSALLNIVFTQQFGCGFYDSASLKPYDYIHCYLNIPDTSGRDSLFQAEARRCKEIIDIVDSNKKETHFCAFDELYSGTNPDEAEISAASFMEYLVKNKNVSCLLTTHFVNVCKKLEDNKYIINCHMESEKTENKIIYKYKIKEGISHVKGGINVLYDMHYPSEIIENTLKQQNM